MDSNIWDLFVQIKKSSENSELSLDKNEDKNENIIKNENENDIIKNISFINKILSSNKLNSNDRCINCNETDCLQNESEIIVCIKCGVDNGPIIDYDQEWRYYGNDDNKRSSDPNRCGVPNNSLINETSLSTVILGKGYETYRRLNSWNGLTYKERSLINILNSIAQKANIDNIPQCIIDKTMIMYKILSEDYIKRGASRESLIAACFLNALRDKGMIRSTDEIANLFEIKSKKLSKGCNEFTELMFNKNIDYINHIKPIEPKDLIERYSTLLNFTENHIKVAISCSTIVDKLGICQENNPKSIAVGCIYLISQTYNLGITKKEIAEKCKTSEVTISNTYIQMNKFKKYLLPINNK
jgi:transcription initiation factor TFIIIB Brf1 subunit/transcription initiation factor TFIIB